MRCQYMHSELIARHLEGKISCLYATLIIGYHHTWSAACDISSESFSSELLSVESNVIICLH
jgi:hypothetical protein